MAGVSIEEAWNVAALCALLVEGIWYASRWGDAIFSCFSSVAMFV